MGVGVYLAVIGAALAAAFSGIGSSVGVSKAAQATTGVVAEDPSKFGRCMIIMLLPATQGLYGLVIAIVALLQAGVMSHPDPTAVEAGTHIFYTMTTGQGWAILGACLPMAIVGMLSGIYQGKAAASSIAMVAKRPDQSGKGIIVTVMIETYALLALLVSFLAIFLST